MEEKMGYYLSEIIELRKSFAEAYSAKKYAEAIETGNKILDLYADNNAKETEGCAGDMYNLAVLYDEVNLNDRAKELYRDCARLRKKLLGEDDLSYIQTLENLGILLGSNGETAEAVEMLKTVRNYYKDKDGINSLTYERSLYNLGNALADGGKYDEAIRTLSDCLDCAKRVRDIPVGEFEDIHVSIADACRRQGNLRRARDEYQKAFRMAEREKADNSYFRMAYYLNAAVVYQRCELYKDAAEIYEKAVAMREELMDTKHLDFISVLNNLAVIYNKDGRHQDAMKVHERVLKLVESILGKDHVFYGDVITNIGVDYCAAGDFDKAIEYHNEALELKKGIVGEKHIHYIWTLISLAEVYEKMEKYERASEIQNKALELKRECFGEVNEQVAESLVALGRICMKSGDYEKAQGFFMQALIMSKEIITVSGIPVRGYGENIRLIAETSCLKGDKENTVSLCDSLIAYRKSEKGDRHPKYVRALYDSADLMMRLGDYNKAEKYLDSASDLAETLLGNDTPFGMKCLYAHCQALYSDGQYSKASEKLKKAASVYKKYDGGEEELIKITFMQAKCQYILGFPKKADELVFRAEGMVSRSEKDTEQLLMNEKADYAAVAKRCGDYRQAADILDEVIEKIKTDDKKVLYNIYINSASALNECGEYAKAAARADKAADCAAEPKEGCEASVASAKALLKLGKYASAAEELNKAADMLSKDTELYNQYASKIFCMTGETYAMGGDAKKGSESLEKGLAEAKAKENLPIEEYMQYLMLAADMETKNQEYGKAIEYMSENALLIRRERGETIEFADMLIKTAELYMVQKRCDDAVTMYDKAAEIYGEFCGKNSKEKTDTVLKSCEALKAAGKYKELAEKIENTDCFGDREKDFSALLAEAYRSTGAVGKLMKLKLKGQPGKN